MHPLSTELRGLCITILDEATVSRLIFVCLSPKSNSRDSEICGENLWCKFVVKICSENLWCKFVVKICGENLSVRPHGVCLFLSVCSFVVKICGENLSVHPHGVCSSLCGENVVKRCHENIPWCKLW